jgi:hypothetical protein
MKKLLYTIIAGTTVCSAFAQLPNAGFEQWDSSSVVNNHKVYEPVNWLTTNADMASLNLAQPVSITTDAHSGKYAVKITSAIDDQGLQAGIIVSGKTYSGNFQQSNAGEKFKLTGRISSFDGYYKYDAMPGDSFRIVLAFYYKGSFYGRAFFQGGHTSTYTKFNLELAKYNGVAPDSAKFIIYSSISNFSAGSKLFLDDMNIGFVIPTGIDEPNQTPEISIYPNPSTDQITIRGITGKETSYIIRDSKGSTQQQGTLSAQYQINTTGLSEGLYFLELKTENGSLPVKKFTNIR